LVRPNGSAYLVTDTVGFIGKLPHNLVEAFSATLEETRRAELILHVLDASAPEERRLQMLAAVESTLDEIGAHDVPRLVVLNKLDLIEQAAREELITEHPHAVPVSAATGDGMDRLAEHVEVALRRMLREVELLVPYSDGPSLAALHRLGRPLRREDTPEGVRVSALLPERLAGRFARFAVAS
ncbi:MAG: GTPase, partial [Solirubrobacteraceae bacterium]